MSNNKKKVTNAMTPLLSSCQVSNRTEDTTWNTQTKYLSTSARHDKIFTTSTESSTSSLRKPYHYPVNKQFIGQPALQKSDVESSANYRRYMYYNKLARSLPETIESLRIPPHVVPYHFFVPFTSSDGDQKQSSFLTIFAIWNMLMGSSLLCLPWAMQQAGFFLGIMITLLMVFICFYTSVIIVTLPKMLNIKCVEFGDVCYQIFGRGGQVLCIASSLITLAGTCFVYWILLSNFLFNIVSYIYEQHTSAATERTDNMTSHLKLSVSLNSTWSAFGEALDPFYAIWNISETVPFFLGVLLIPILFVRSPTFFMKFNALGTFSIIYLFSFMSYKAWRWGFFNFTFEDRLSPYYIPLASSQFAVQIGILSQGLLIQNCVLTVLKLQRNPENNRRDLGIAYSLVGCAYVAFGSVVYLAMPISKNLIKDNFLDNFDKDEIMAIVARGFLFIQIFCLFPLFAYMLRTQLFNVFLSKPRKASFKHIFIFNLVFCGLCILFAIEIPFIGTITRFTGSFAGLILIFVFPPVAYMRALARTKVKFRTKSCFSFNGIPVHILALNAFIIAFGLLNCVLQFLV